MTQATNVSRETNARLDTLISEVARWQRMQNLIGSGTIDTIRHRHIDDSLQLAEFANEGDVWLDIGSGGGFPGLVVAIARPDLTVHLVESNQRKCAFLRQAARATGTTVHIHDRRIEEIVPDFIGCTEVVSARAVAALDTLLEWTFPLLKTGTIGVFPKGRGLQAELTHARNSWTFDVEIRPSRTEPDAGILRITSIEKRL